MKKMENEYSYWKMLWRQFLNNKLGVSALFFVILFCLVGIYAPFLASSKLIAIFYGGELYFPLFRYLFYPGFYTKPLDIFFNIMIFTFPIFLSGILLSNRHGKLLKYSIVAAASLQIGIFALLCYLPIKDPASDPSLTKERIHAQQELEKSGKPRTWQYDLKYTTPYGRLNEVLRYRHLLKQHARILSYGAGHQKDPFAIPTLWQVSQKHEQHRLQRHSEQVAKYKSGESDDKGAYDSAQSAIDYTVEKKKWLERENEKIAFEWLPFLRPYHWEEDVGGEQSMNQFLPWWELSRVNRKDLVAALIFGVRISLVVGILAVSLAVSIGIPIGSLAGYYGGKFDILVSRILEIWESMPTFFMLLLVVAITQSKSIFLVIAVVGIFGWTGFSRYIRGEFFKQRNLSYVEACHALGFKDSYIMFTHILPNAIPPVLTLLPFAIMGAITSEAALSFLGLGEEGSCSWGVLMDEGRSAFPGESYLLWPPAILLTFLLVSIALVGDALRDAIDPKMHR